MVSGGSTVVEHYHPQIEGSSLATTVGKKVFTDVIHKSLK